MRRAARWCLPPTMLGFAMTMAPAVVPADGSRGGLGGLALAQTAGPPTAQPLQPSPCGGTGQPPCNLPKVPYERPKSSQQWRPPNDAPANNAKAFQAGPAKP